MLKQNIDALIQSATLEKNADRLNALRMIKTNLLVAEKSGKEYTEELEFKTLLKMKSSINDSIQKYTEAGRNDLADNERKGLDVLAEFLPKEASDDDIKAFANEIIDGLDHQVSMRDMREILAKVQAKYPTANGKIVSEAVKARS